MALTQISDVIVPRVFDGYTQNITTQKSELIASGAVVRDPALDAKLAGGGLTFDVPIWRDLANEAENVSDDTTTLSTPSKTSAYKQVGVRLNRNKSWSTADLTAQLAGSDPAQSIANRVGYYWTRRQQALFIAVMKGIFADNDAAPTGSEHTQYDLTVDIKGASFSAATSFSASAFIDAITTMGDNNSALSMIMVHSIVEAVMKKKNLIEFIPDARGEVNIPTYLGRRVIVDDGMPVPSSGVFESWIFGAGAIRLGMHAPEVPTEIERLPSAGNGGGTEILHNRVQWAMHPEGYTFDVASPANGGPTNDATTGNMANAATWKRTAPERKQIKIARLVTREF